METDANRQFLCCSIFKNSSNRPILAKIRIYSSIKICHFLDRDLQLIHLHRAQIHPPQDIYPNIKTNIKLGFILCLYIRDVRISLENSFRACTIFHSSPASSSPLTRKLTGRPAGRRQSIFGWFFDV